MQPMSDDNTAIGVLKEMVKKFRDARDWEKFHDAKNLAEALSIETGELMEHFLWKEKKDIVNLLKTDNAFREEVSNELADVFGYVLHLSETTGIDLADALRAKYEKNEKKYPVEKAKGNATKYTKL